MIEDPNIGVIYVMRTCLVCVCSLIRALGQLKYKMCPAVYDMDGETEFSVKITAR